MRKSVAVMLIMEKAGFMNCEKEIIVSTAKIQVSYFQCD